jgi:hypothetical protein
MNIGVKRWRTRSLERTEWASVVREVKTITLKYKTKKTTTRIEHVVGAAGAKVPVTTIVFRWRSYKRG